MQTETENLRDGRAGHLKSRNIFLLFTCFFLFLVFFFSGHLLNSTSAAGMQAHVSYSTLRSIIYPDNAFLQDGYRQIADSPANLRFSASDLVPQHSKTGSQCRMQIQKMQELLILLLLSGCLSAGTAARELRSVFVPILSILKNSIPVRAGPVC